MPEVDLMPSDVVPPSCSHLNIVPLPHSTEHVAGIIQIIGDKAGMIVEKMTTHATHPPEAAERRFFDFYLLQTSHS
jgi:hypothetical protein